MCAKEKKCRIILCSRVCRTYVSRIVDVLSVWQRLMLYEEHPLLLLFNFVVLFCLFRCVYFVFLSFFLSLLSQYNISFICNVWQLTTVIVGASLCYFHNGICADCMFVSDRRFWLKWSVVLEPFSSCFFLTPTLGEWDSDTREFCC